MIDNTEALKRAVRVIKDAEHRNAMAESHDKVGILEGPANRYDSTKLVLAHTVIELVAENERLRKLWDEENILGPEETNDLLGVIERLVAENERLQKKIEWYRDGTDESERNKQLRRDNQALIETLRPFLVKGGLPSQDAATHRVMARKLIAEIEQRSD